MMQSCPKCQGKGKVPGKRHKQKCPQCKGKRTVPFKNPWIVGSSLTQEDLAKAIQAVRTTPNPMYTTSYNLGTTSMTGSAMVGQASGLFSKPF